MLDYQKDNFFELDAFLVDLAKEYGSHLNGCVSDYIGCTKEEIEDVMKTTVRKIVPLEKVPMYEKEIDKLLAQEIENDL